MLKKPPRVRDNNGALQVRLRLDGRDHFINRLGRFDDPVAQARGQAICAEIWRDSQQGDLDLSLNRLFQAFPKKMNIKLDRQSEKCIREMIRRNRLYGSPSELVNKAIASFYEQQKKRGFK